MELTGQFYSGGAMTKANKERSILQAAEALFLVRRYDQVTLDDVSHKAGVGKGTIYRYFKNKQDLYGRMILHSLDKLNASVEATLAGAAPADRKLYDTARTMRNFYEKKRGRRRAGPPVDFRRMVHVRSLHKQFAERRRTLVRLIADIMRQGAQEGAYRTDVSAEAAATMFLGLVRSCLWAHGGDKEPSVPMKRIVDVMVEGLRKR